MKLACRYLSIICIVLGAATLKEIWILVSKCEYYLVVEAHVARNWVGEGLIAYLN